MFIDNSVVTVTYWLACSKISSLFLAQQLRTSVGNGPLFYVATDMYVKSDGRSAARVGC